MEGVGDRSEGEAEVDRGPQSEEQGEGRQRRCGEVAPDGSGNAGVLSEGVPDECGDDSADGPYRSDGEHSRPWIPDESGGRLSAFHSMRIRGLLRTGGIAASGRFVLIEGEGGDGREEEQDQDPDARRLVRVDVSEHMLAERIDTGIGKEERNRGEDGESDPEHESHAPRASVPIHTSILAGTLRAMGAEMFRIRCVGTTSLVEGVCRISGEDGPSERGR